MLAAAAAMVMAMAGPASAHGFGERYELPLPLSLYLYGAAAVVVFSFVVIGLFVRRPSRAYAFPRFDLSAHPVGRMLSHPGLAAAVKLVALGLFIVTVSAGFIGNQNPYRNIAPTMVWIIGWVGLAYVSAFVGNLWELINPWRTIFEAAERCYRRLGRRDDLSLRLPYPEALSVWPAVVLLLAFSWIELVYPSPAVPAHIAWFVVGYSFLTWAGMGLFGCDIWLRHGEVFSVVFDTIARFAPIEVRAGTPIRQLALRPFGTGLLEGRAVSTSMTAFVLLLLSIVLYDGLLNTPEWSAFERALGTLVTGFGEDGPMAIRTAGLLAFWLVFLGAYVAVSAIMSVIAARSLSPLETAQSFAMTLVPIAIGYHLAHYLVFLLIQGQYIVPLMSDPFGYGWDLFGTAGYRVDLAIVGARFAWYAAVTAIVLGHIAAVYLAHVKATQVLEPHRTALRSQIPLTALMAVYTFVSLSILAEPIVERRASDASSTAPALVGIPQDAVLPAPGDGHLQAIGPGKFARAKLTYRVLGSSFHDGSRTSAADLLYSYMFAYRWGARGEDRAAHYDPFIDAATAPMRQQVLALRFAGTDSTSKSFRIADVNVVRELLTIEVYAKVTPADPERDATVLPPWSTLPWHVIVLMEEAVSRGWAAFSQAEAARRGVEWLDFVRSERLNGRMASLVKGFEREGYRPAALQSLVSAEEARKRWAALAAFYRSRGHFLVTNGPYVLKAWSAKSVVMEAFRDLSYPLGVGSYDAYAIPRRGHITKVEQEKNRVRLSGDFETIMKFQRSYEVKRESIQAVARDVLKRAEPQCRYVVINDDGRVVLAGIAGLAGDATFQADLDGKLAAGRYTLFAMIAVNGNAMNTEIRRIPVSVSP